MDLEKYTNSKVYTFFEWAFKLIVWNLLAVSIIILIAGTPLFIFFQNLDKKEVVEAKTYDNDLIVTLKNEDSVNVGEYKIYGEIDNSSITISDDFSRVSFMIGEHGLTIINEERNIKNIDSLYFDDGYLFAQYNDYITDLGNIYDSEIDVSSCKLDTSNNLIIVLNNGTQISFNNPYGYSQTLSGFLVILAVVLAIIAFIPSYSTIFCLIKIYGEDGHSGTFGLFFDRLWDNIKALWKVILIIVPIMSLFAFAFYIYYLMINANESVPFIITFSYNFLLVSLIIIILYILNIPMTVGYFRMKTKSILKFTLSMTFKNFLYSLLYLVLLVLPILVCFLNNIFIPFYFLFGLSLPLFVEYFMINKKYRYIVNNLNNNNTILQSNENNEGENLDE